MGQRKGHGPAAGPVRLMTREVLKELGPLPTREIEAEVRRRGVRTAENFSATITNMATAREIYVVGHVVDFEVGKFPRARDADRVYALCPQRGVLPPDALRVVTPGKSLVSNARLIFSVSPAKPPVTRPRRPRSNSGSGVIAPPPFVTGYRW